jgi:hypothetical protein
MNEKEKHWCGPVPGFDDFGYPIADTFVDGRTSKGPWAIMAPKTHSIHGKGLGQGCGQMYRKQEDGRWLKISQ